MGNQDGSMSEYHKIDTVFMRDPETKHKTLLFGQWARPEFGLLKEIGWVFTEKVDGTNIRVTWDAEHNLVLFGGRTDRAQIPTPLASYLVSHFTADRLASGLKGSLVLYGEGCGAKIQKCGGVYGADQRFILFDAKAGDVWLERETVEQIAEALEIPVAPIIHRGPLMEGIEMTRAGVPSLLAENFIMEGFVMRPHVELRNRLGSRIISKIKHRDFA